jgi:Spy/CpxP family protein refolding chaperone
MHWWLKQARRAARDWEAAAAHCGPGAAAPNWEESAKGFAEGASFGGATFGVRRPLRFLAYRLGLDESQTREVARILDELKTERAQAAVDHRRMSGALADVLVEDTFDAARAAEAAGARVQSAERMRQATVRALDRIHRVLRPEQRATLAMLIRTGAVTL